MLLFSVIVNFVMIGMCAIYSGKAKDINDENIKLRLDNNVLKTENKDLQQQIRSYIRSPV